MKINVKLSEEVSDNGVENDKLYLYRQWMGTIASSLASFTCGFTYGISAVLIPKLREDKSINYDASYDSWIASSASLAMIVGSIACGPILDRYGRRVAHISLGIPFILGWIFIACANSTELILIGRFLTGLSTGATKPVSLVYIGEISDPKFRAAALFFPGIIAHTGILLSHLSGYYLPWSTSAIIFTVPAILSCVAFLFLKESPMWLISEDRIEDGIETFKWFRGTNETSESELKLVLQRQNEKKCNRNAKDTLKALCSMSVIKPMLVIIVIMVDVQFSGVNVITFYAQDIFEKAFSKDIDVFLLMMLTDFIRSLIAVAIFLIGKSVPKKVSFLCSTFGVSVFVTILVACFLFKISLGWLHVSCLVIYIAFSSAIVSIGWSFAPEFAPNNIRGLISGLNSALSFITQFIIIKITPHIMNEYGESALFGLFAISTLVCGIILVFVLPETNGKTLQSIEDGYNNNKNEETKL